MNESIVNTVKKYLVEDIGIPTYDATLREAYEWYHSLSENDPIRKRLSRSSSDMRYKGWVFQVPREAGEGRFSAEESPDWSKKLTDSTTGSYAFVSYLTLAIALAKNDMSFDYPNFTWFVGDTMADDKNRKAMLTGLPEYRMRGKGVPKPGNYAAVKWLDTNEDDYVLSDTLHMVEFK